MILLLDNKDSFVWNLAQALRMLGHEVTVLRTDDPAVDDRAAHARALVLSPGPGHPADAAGLVPAIRRWSGHKPILGVCLGHQAIAIAFGGTVERGAPCHGRTSPIVHAGQGLYRDLPSPVAFCRYHSLCVAVRDLPPVLAADAHLADGTIMGLHHRSAPTFGVQFHPESFRSAHGPRLLQNFLREVA